MYLDNLETKSKIDKRLILICTAFSEKWPKESGNILFLGEWCLKYDKKDVWEKLSYTIFPYHWEDREKRKDDYLYLESVYENVLENLSSFLNLHHKTNHSNLFWRIVIGPWLMFYISSLFDRFEMLRLVFSTGKKFNCNEFKCDTITSVSFDFDSFGKLMASDDWNHDIYQRVLNYFIDIKCFENQIENIGKRRDNFNLYKVKKKMSKLEKIFFLFDSVFYRLSKKNKIVLYNSYFPVLSLIKLHRLLKLKLSFYSNIFSYDSTCEFDLITRGLKLHSLKSDNFEKFLLNNILIDLPLTYLECFYDVYNKSIKIANAPKYIVTAGSYWNNDFFKIWTARLIDLRKSKLLILDHGGSFVLNDNTFNHESKISEIYISWILPYMHNQLQLPPSKYVGKKRKQHSGNNLLFIGTEENRYAYKASSTPISSLSLVGVNIIIKIIENLDEYLREFVCVRPYNNPDGWLSEKRIQDKFPDICFLSHLPFNKIFFNTRLIVCTQPQTSFTECLLSGLPTILVFEKSLYDFVPVIHDLVDKMVQCKMIFYDSDEASKHVNLIWNDVSHWWQSEDVQKCLKRFFTEAIQYRDDSLIVWHGFFNNLIK